MEIILLSPEKSANIEDNEDRISTLPDDVLCHILSFLTTKQAFSTSILSKAWEDIWTLTPNLDFSDHFSYEIVKKIGNYATLRSSFKDYVDRVLFCHGGSVVQKCNFKCINEDSSPNIYAWICSVIACDVQELIVETSLYIAQKLPWRVFTCKTLVVLRIRGMFVLDLPANIRFPCLKTLRLAHVVYVDDVSMHKLISSCPVLEDLAIVREGWDGVQIMKISAPQLKRLAVLSPSETIDSSLVSTFKTEINAPILEYLELRDNSVLTASSIGLSSSLVEAQVHCKCSSGFFDRISQVKVLLLFADAVLSLFAVVRDSTLPTLWNLTKLLLYVDDDQFIKWELLPGLLKNCPNLEVLIFPDRLISPISLDGWEFRDFNWHRPEKDPECLLSSLKTVVINNFLGIPGEEYFVEYLLERAKVLERMTIRGYHFAYHDSDRKRDLQFVRNRVLNFPRGSSNCQLVFTV